MTLQEILKSQGLSPEQVDTIVGEMKQNKIFTAGEENLDIRYSKLKADHDTLTAQYGESTKLIDQLKAGTKDSEALQGKISSYESQVLQLQEQLKQTQLESAVKVALLGAKVTDVDYMAFRLKEKGDLALDEQGNIKGIDDKLAGLKTQFPSFFDGGADQRKLEPFILPDRKTDTEQKVSKEEFNKMGYNAKVELKQSNPELYSQLTKG